MSRILVTDLDGTLLGGTPDDRIRLRDALARHPEVTTVFATGRGPASIREVLRDPLVPRPRWIIADVGATVIDGTDFTPVDPVQEQLRAGWPGPDRVRAALRRFPALAYQQGVVQNGRCSYHVDPDGLTDELTGAVEALGCTWVYSADRYFDVLPPSASKGNALRALAAKLGWQREHILVAGDSLNDLSLFRLGTHAVVVAGAERALLTALAEDALVHRADRAGAGGIHAALRKLRWLSADRDPDPDPAPGSTSRPGSRHAVGPNSLVVAYHRPPLHWNGDDWQPPSSPNGILPTLSSAFADGLPGVWVTALTGRDRLAPLPQPTTLPLSPVPLDTATWHGYFHRACKETLWPVLMSEPDRSVHDERAWADYRRVNARFAEHISGQAAPGATVWLHDYNLWLVPGLLRRLRPDLRTGLFHHTPFPAPEVFDTLLVADELRRSLGCLDWAGFHTEDFAERFRRTLAGRSDPPHTAVHPLGIDRPFVEELARRRAAHLPAAHLPAAHRHPASGRLVLSVERLDYAKAPIQKVDAIDHLLSQRPELRGRLTFRLVCPPPEPGITAYDTTRRRLEQRVADVNATWKKGTWLPVDYLPRGLSAAEVIDEYLAADVLWVTSLQDGMNLTAKEFTAAQAALLTDPRSRTGPGPGVLVLSRHTGAAAELGPAALLTDPRSRDDLSAVLARALDLGPAERRARMDRLSRLLGHERPADWAARIVDGIRTCTPGRTPAGTPDPAAPTA
ncbi:trehalose-6-phosphate synthase [Kitasatospora aureofaciens]|uniref:Glucosylglycerol-phosphate synthase n=1 Tax=Kitasatospora aureofaciens TaxID=1894 RepID=A0A1E7N403_KITAU|nr:trehalose-6-phosphate synthase [Kitasatospora aureofaciens]OEV35416.1 glucosylglycerol-phosphate synthase [Kitasatospora aureofaciens]